MNRQSHIKCVGGYVQQQLAVLYEQRKAERIKDVRASIDRTTDACRRYVTNKRGDL